MLHGLMTQRPSILTRTGNRVASPCVHTAARQRPQKVSPQRVACKNYPPDAEDIARLRACGLVVIKRLSGMQLQEKNFSFYGAVHELEARLIEQALEKEAGSVSRAARRLGLKHQSLSYMLQARHRKLMDKRTPPEKRLKSIIKKDC